MDIEKSFSDVTEKKPVTHALLFHGSGSEYFRIWIVNTALTILTLGLYWPWALVRKRKYFYDNTELAGERFQYDGPANLIFRGYLIIIVGYLIYNFGGALSIFVPIAVLIIFLLLWPLLFYKAIRFRARYSAYRGLRFQFVGTLGKSYTINLGLTLLMIITIPLFLIGLIFFPYIEFKKKNYVWNNLKFGTSFFNFQGSESYFFRTYLKAFGMVIVPIIVMVMVASMMNLASGGTDFEHANNTGLAAFSMLIFLVNYVLLILAFVGFKELITARITNHQFNSMDVQGIRFQSDLEFWKLFGIQLSNLVLTIITLGIFTPWAEVRRTRYILDNIYVKAVEGQLETFINNTERDDENAIGDAAGEIFDFEIGF